VETKLTQKVEQVKTDYPEARVEAWAEDEHRIGLTGLKQNSLRDRAQNSISREFCVDLSFSL